LTSTQPVYASNSIKHENGLQETRPWCEMQQLEAVNKAAAAEKHKLLTHTTEAMLLI